MNRVHGKTFEDLGEQKAEMRDSLIDIIPTTSSKAKRLISMLTSGHLQSRRAIPKTSVRRVVIFGGSLSRGVRTGWCGGVVNEIRHSAVAQQAPCSVGACLVDFGVLRSVGPMVILPPRVSHDGL